VWMCDVYQVRPLLYSCT